VSFDVTNGSAATRTIDGGYLFHGIVYRTAPGGRWITEIDGQSHEFPSQEGARRFILRSVEKERQHS